MNGNLKSGKLYIIDDFIRLKSQDVINEFYKSGSFFLVVTRLNNFIRTSIDINAIYTIVPRTKDGVTLNEFRLAYENSMIGKDYTKKVIDKNMVDENVESSVYNILRNVKKRSSLVNNL